MSKFIAILLYLHFLFSFVPILSAEEGAQETSYKFEDAYKVYELERVGILHYRQQEYAKAVEKLTIAAEKGMKNSQHYLGVMYLKGQAVPVSIENGMAWLGVANEIEVKEWRELYVSLYEKLNDSQKSAIDEKLKEFISSYGMKAQRMTCKTDRVSGTKRRRGRQLACHKRGNGSALFSERRF